MTKLTLRFFALIGFLLSISGCSNGLEIFEVCTKKKLDGSLDESCTSEVLKDGTCQQGFVKVKSKTYKYPMCTMEL